MSQIINPITQPDEILYLCFELDDRTYALNAEFVMEVTMLPALITPQKLPENTVGILNYNGLLINVPDIRRLLNLPQKNFTVANQIIIVKGEESLWAIIVDKVSDFITTNKSSVQSSSLGTMNSFIRAFYQEKNRLINILNISALESFIRETKSTVGDVNYCEFFPKDEKSLEILEKRNREIAVKMNFALENDFFGKDKYILFKINGHIYCIYSDYVKELISRKNLTVTKIPYTPEYIKGIINLKGDFFTVLSLKEFIGFEQKDDSEEEKIIVLNAGELKLALLVDEILDVMNISKDQIQNKNDLKLDNLYIKAEIYNENTVINLLNLDKLLQYKRLCID